MTSNFGCSTEVKIPSYLNDYENLYKENPSSAALEWFKNAKFGLFMHDSLYSLLGRGEWVMLRDKIPVAEYAKPPPKSNWTRNRPSWYKMEKA